MMIVGGTFDIDSADDAIHSNASINISGGSITISSGDDGIHADLALSIAGGIIKINKSYEGLESKVITISNGEIYSVSSDDGINVGGGNDGSSMNGRPGQNTMSASGDSTLYIHGGYIVIDSQGDGLDSNGSIQMTGGTVIVNGPTQNNNGALDYDGTFELSGGILVAAGSSGMAEAPSDQSQQYSIRMNFNEIQKAGSLVHLEDGNGNTIVTFAPSKEYQSIVIASQELSQNSKYSLYTGGVSTGSESNGLYMNGEYSGGSEIVSFTIANTVTYLSESGVTTERSSGGGGGPRGRR
ncbi:hypothetical protein D3C81_1357310 [compost metagenome]